MEATKILQANILDIVFENRNKAYGAYTLRKNYYRQLFLALAITLVTAGIISFLILRRSNKDAFIKPVLPTTISVNTLKEVKPLAKPKIKIPKPQKAEPPLKVKMNQFTKPVPTADKNVTEMPPKQDANLTIGPVTQNGKSMNGLLTAPPEVKSLGGKNFRLGGSNGDASEGKDFTSVQIEARFPGGADAWMKYLKANLRENIPLDNNAPQGRYMVTVSFLVSVDGSISDVKAVNVPNPDYGTAAEAVRVIERGPKWMPAIQNGRPVPYHQKQNIIFEVQE